MFSILNSFRQKNNSAIVVLYLLVTRYLCIFPLVRYRFIYDYKVASFLNYVYQITISFIPRFNNYYVIYQLQIVSTESGEEAVEKNTIDNNKTENYYYVISVGVLRQMSFIRFNRCVSINRNRFCCWKILHVHNLALKKTWSLMYT